MAEEIKQVESDRVELSPDASGSVGFSLSPGEHVLDKFILSYACNVNASSPDVLEMDSVKS